MTETSILSKEEFIKRTELLEDRLERWLKLGLIIPVGHTAGEVSFFAPSQLETIEKIRTLLGLGYDEEEVAKIIRRVGLPSSEGQASEVPQKLRTVGELAQICDLNTRTIKHWEEKGLLQPDARSEGGFRLYGPASVARCKRIVDLQNLGYTLEQIHGMDEMLLEIEPLGETLKAELSDEVIGTLETHSVALKKRIKMVRDSAKRLEDLLKRRGKLVSTLKSQLEKQIKNQKQAHDE